MSDKIRCPECGAENYSTDARCLSCGTDLAAHHFEEVMALAAQAEARAQATLNRRVVFFGLLFALLVIGLGAAALFSATQGPPPPTGSASAKTTSVCSVCGGAGGYYETIQTGTQRGRCDMCGPEGLYSGIQGRRLCSRCEATGLEWNKRLHLHQQCILCGGTGARFCDECSGTGYENRSITQQVWRACPHCSGHGGQ